jgi:hypothetical protein
MDFTTNPQNNMQPDETNFIFLADLYGTFNGSYTPTNESLVESSVLMPSQDTPDEELTDVEETETNDDLHRTRDRLLSETENAIQRERMILRSDDLDTLFDDKNIRRTRNSRRMLRSSAFVEEYEVDLGEGYTVQFHLLLATS